MIYILSLTYRTKIDVSSIKNVAKSLIVVSKFRLTANLAAK
jgi:hypothetical protein